MDIGAVAMDPARAPFVRLRSARSEFEGNRDARIRCMSNYTIFIVASQGGKHLFPPQGITYKTGVIIGSSEISRSIEMTDIL
jgi:hypothetical protein